ncbi:NLP/P60 protein [Frankia canadensis]|uniref:NLP/P60 protein n=1 Tax=Frankia canadensis TaxID=1836972 RepID=A0A2I2KI60_9ACTN|nr:C40 family peptidase [Frankia canadensis]SNQ45358.1 NLP/P60 protein [Frankia canadensis]SOU52648.1 NLP/P60 protein [Frankia canadensis]
MRLTPAQRRAATVAMMTTGGFAAASTGFALATSDNVPAVPTMPVTTADLVTGSRPPAPHLQAAPLAGAIADLTPASGFTALSITPDHPAINPNAPVIFTVRVVAADGRTPLAGETVRIAVVDGPKWTTTARLRTNGAGEAYISARLLSTTTLTAVFDGSDALRPSLADATTVTVTASSPQSASADAGGATSIAGTPSVVTEVPASGIGAKAVYLASLQKGKPYVWGAAGPYAFDCSGYAQYVYRQLGRNLPRTAQQQFQATIRIPKSGKQPGDLIFFGTPGNITHMGIYAGNGYMWAAPQSGRTINLQPIYSSTYYVGRVS